LDSSLAGTESAIATVLARALDEVGNTEVRMRTLGEDDTGTLQEAQVEALDTTPAAGTTGQVTYLSRALEGLGQDHLRAAVYASDPSNALARLNLNNNGQLRTEVSLDGESVFIDAEDDDGNTLQPSAETLSQATADPDGLVTYLARALASQGQDELVSRIADAAGTQLDPLNQDALESVADDELRARVHDSAGAQVDPALATRYLDSQTTNYDLVGSGDLTIGPGAVERGTAVTLAATSTDNNAFSVSVEWTDGAGNTFQTESAADIGLDTITEDYARLVRKSPQVELTVTDESGAGQNNINIHADTER